MTTRGRPRDQITPARARVMTYVRKHWPCPVMQVARATGVERARCKRIIRWIDEKNAGPNYSPMAGGDFAL